LGFTTFFVTVLTFFTPVGFFILGAFDLGAFGLVATTAQKRGARIKKND
jgi:hypothetical protein